MTEFPIPVVGLGPGSQGGDEGLELIGSPGEMAVFAPPRVSDNASAAVRAAALEELLALRDAMRATDFARGLTRDMRGLTPAVRALVNEALGEGEVAITVQGPGRLRVQETVFAGVWRVLRDATDGQPAVDRVEAGAMPAAVIDAARAGTVRQAPALAQPAGVMNAPAILAELNEHAATRLPHAPAHIVNLTLLPVTPEDLAWLGDCLGFGAVAILSRGYGNCRITSTGLRDTWWVQYFNSTDKLILNTLEVTRVPDVAPAAEEDYLDSIERLGEWIDALREEQ